MIQILNALIFTLFLASLIGMVFSLICVFSQKVRAALGISKAGRWLLFSFIGCLVSVFGMISITGMYRASQNPAEEISVTDDNQS